MWVITNLVITHIFAEYQIWRLLQVGNHQISGYQTVPDTTDWTCG